MKIDATVALDHPLERYAFDLQEAPTVWKTPLNVDFIGEIAHTR